MNVQTAKKRTINVEAVKNLKKQKRNLPIPHDEGVESCTNCRTWQAKFEKLKDDKTSPNSTAEDDMNKKLQQVAKFFGDDETKPVKFSELTQKIIKSKMDADNRLKNYADENRKLNDKAKILEYERDNMHQQRDHEIQSRELSDQQVRKLEETFENVNLEKATLGRALEAEVSKSKLFIKQLESLKGNASGDDDLLIKSLNELIKNQHNLINDLMKNQQTLMDHVKSLVDIREKQYIDYSKTAPKLAQSPSILRQFSSPPPTKRVSFTEPPPSYVRRTLLLDGPPSREKQSIDELEIMDMTPSTPARNTDYHAMKSAKQHYSKQSHTVRHNNADSTDHAKAPVLSRTTPYVLIPFSSTRQSETAVVPGKQTCPADPRLKKFCGNLLSTPAPPVDTSEAVEDLAANRHSTMTPTRESMQNFYWNDAIKTAKKAAATKTVVPGEYEKESMLEKYNRLLKEKEDKNLKTFKAVTSSHAGKK